MPATEVRKNSLPRIVFVIGYNINRELLVALSGICAWLHQSTNRPAVRGVTAGIALVTSVAALVVGVMLST